MNIWFVGAQRTAVLLKVDCTEQKSDQQDAKVKMICLCWSVLRYIRCWFFAVSPALP